jgi:hypothetical protein
LGQKGCLLVLNLSINLPNLEILGVKKVICIFESRAFEFIGKVVNKRKGVNGPTPFTVRPSPVSDRPKMPPIGLAHLGNSLHDTCLGRYPTALSAP